MPDVISLSELQPPDAARLPDMVPPPRFGATTFAGYEPQHPSQQTARSRVQAFVAEAGQGGGFRWFWQPPAAGCGLYLDGGFGVGKTHLLAAAYSAYPGPDKAYLSFAELVHLIGVLGMAEAQRRLGGYRLWCVDEFELDDPGNTLIVKTFALHLMARGASLMTTSNTPPEAQGAGRFNAEDFRREIQSLSERFEVLEIGGPDYRRRDHLAALLSEGALESLLRKESAQAPKVQAPKVQATWPELQELLAAHHPVRYGALLAQMGTLFVRGAETLETQNDALRFVHFIDKLYDMRVGLRLAGEVALSELFAPSYREGAYAKKHHRCLSRISELLEERPLGVADSAA